jgi:agmatinase
MEAFDEELRREFVAAGIATHEPVKPATNPDEEMHRVRRAAEPIVKAGKFLLSLGGEHSVTVPLVATVRAEHDDVSVLQIDAHADLRDAYEGTRISHGCVMRRLLEMTDRICQVGIRSFSTEERDSCPRQVENFITPLMVESDPKWVDRALGLLGEKVYVTVDVDGFDPAYVPGTGTPEPGGLTWRQVTSLLRRVCRERTVVAADIVEVAPIPNSHATEFLAARLAYKIIAYAESAGSEPKQH